MKQTIWIVLGLVLTSLLTKTGSYPVSASNASPRALYGQIEPSQSQIKDYVRQKSIEMGIKPETADFIISKESQYCGWGRDGKYEPDIKGDDGESIGCWQIYLKAHSDPKKPDYVNRACAENLICSTEWSMKMINLGYINWWSTWRFRNKWYN